MYAPNTQCTYTHTKLGEGLGVVVRVGDRTMIGSIASLATATKAEKSTLEVTVGG